MHGKKKGNLQIIQLPNGCTVNDIKVYFKRVYYTNRHRTTMHTSRLFRFNDASTT